jgi:hypothetical protein
MEMIMRRAPFVLTAIMTAALSSGAAFASSDTEIRSVTADGYGNAIIRTTGGAKIIAVGQGADLPQVFADAEADAKAGKTCKLYGTVVRGRSYMYGVGEGDPIPVIGVEICK